MLSCFVVGDEAVVVLTLTTHTSQTRANRIVDMPNDMALPSIICTVSSMMTTHFICQNKTIAMWVVSDDSPYGEKGFSGIFELVGIF